MEIRLHELAETGGYDLHFGTESTLRKELDMKLNWSTLYQSQLTPGTQRTARANREVERIPQQHFPLHKTHSLLEGVSPEVRLMVTLPQADKQSSR
ncbi:hypothetical protein E2C01_023420 [Portunus trituberculatus]|uniref:Uncharacterized protein n=1 Tax=Portunus trituberculatus TaxID=210409 RepID=A0A5B7E7Y0_PORTR|nr:hypothetical protein [Portunus trituberculatus]